MKGKLLNSLIVLAMLSLSTLNSELSTAHAQGTAFTYQGELNDSGKPANGNYDFAFTLFNNSSTNSGQVGGTATHLDMGVTNGLFNVMLDFGGVFIGTNYWLAIGVRSNGSGNFAALSPLQAITPTPYAIFATTAGSAASANSVSATNIAGGIPLTQLAAAVVTNSETNLSLGGSFSGNGGGLTNVQTIDTVTNIYASTVNNAIFGGDSMTSGYPPGITNWTVFFTNEYFPYFKTSINTSVEGQTLWTRLQNFSYYYGQYAAPPPTLTFAFNAPLGYCDFAFGSNALQTYMNFTNLCYLERQSGMIVVAGTVGPGALTGVANDERVKFNEMVRASSSVWDYLVDDDLILSNPEDITWYLPDQVHLTNDALQFKASIVAEVLMRGKHQQTCVKFASPYYPGPDRFALQSMNVGTNGTNGWSLNVNSPYTSQVGSFTSSDSGGVGAGVQVAATFEAGDSFFQISDPDYAWTYGLDGTTGNYNLINGITAPRYGNPIFTATPNGNVGIDNLLPEHLLVVGRSITPAYCDGTSWVNGSDRDSKEHFAAISSREVLEKVSAMPITEWKYKVEADGTRHLGPMAQDFHAAFGLNGSDDKHIATVDEEGVALAAIQGLNQKLNEKDAEIQRLKASNNSLAERLDALEKTVNSLAGEK